MKEVLVFKHLADESLGSLDAMLRSKGLELRVVDPAGPGWPDVAGTPFDPDRWAGLVVMGGLMSAYQTAEYPFLVVECQWLAQAAEAGLPTLGLCLGAQLLALALGARVYRNPQPEIGWYALDLLPAAVDDPLLSQCRTTETVYHWHRDTFDLPRGAVQLARTATCEQQAFRYGPRAYGLQFHLEMTAAMLDDWLSDSAMCAQLDEVPSVDPGEMRRRAPAALAEMRPMAQRVFGRFANWCVERRRQS